MCCTSVVDEDESVLIDITTTNNGQTEHNRPIHPIAGIPPFPKHSIFTPGRRKALGEYKVSRAIT